MVVIECLVSVATKRRYYGEIFFQKRIFLESISRDAGKKPETYNSIAEV